MKRILFFLILASFLVCCGANVGWSEEVLLHNPVEKSLLIFPDGQAFIQERWQVSFQPGTNRFIWQRPRAETVDNFGLQVEGGELQNLIHQLDGLSSTILIEAEEETTGEIIFLWPEPELRVDFTYQVVWEKGANLPQVGLWITIRETGSSSYPLMKVEVLGKVFNLQIEPQGEKRFFFGLIEVKEAEKLIKYETVQSQAQLFWKLHLPLTYLLPAKVEYFEKEKDQVTFLGEGRLTGEERVLELPLGEAADIILEETIVQQEKQDRVYSKTGEEVLYDTLETKVYRLENRAEEAKKVIVYDRVGSSFEIISSSVSPKMERFDLISFEVEFSPQEKKEITFSVRGKNLTRGWILD